MAFYILTFIIPHSVLPSCFQTFVIVQNYFPLCIYFTDSRVYTILFDILDFFPFVSIIMSRFERL